MKTRTWFRVHSFTGVITGLLLFVICWTGTFATLAHEFDWLVTPEARVVDQGSPKSWSAMLDSVRQRYPESEVTRIRVPEYQREAAQFIVDRPDQDWVRVYVDPYTAEVQGTASHLNLWRFFRSVHRRLFIQPGIVGVLFVSVFGVTLTLSAVAALCFYRRWWRRFFSFKWRQGPALWSELHKTVGLWSLWFVFLMGITGAWYGIEGTRILGQVFERSAPERVAVQQGKAPLPFKELMETAREARPELRIGQIALPGGLAGMALGLRGQGDDLLVRDRVNQVAVDAYSGEVVVNTTAEDLSPYERWVHTADPLHFGDFAGLWGQILYFVFGLLLSGLVLTGTYLHARRLLRQGGRKGRHHWRGTLTAVVVSVGVVIASTVFGFYEARAYYGPVVGGSAVLPELLPGVFWFLVGWTMLTVLIILGWSLLLWRPGLVLRG